MPQNHDVSPVWLLYVFAATILDALTDVASDHVIKTEENETDSGSEDEIEEMECVMYTARSRRAAHAKKRSESSEEIVEAVDEDIAALPEKLHQGLMSSCLSCWRSFCFADQGRINNAPVLKGDKGEVILLEKLTSEQDLFCSCCAMLAVSFLIWRYADFSILPPSLQAKRLFDLDDNDAVSIDYNRDPTPNDAYFLCLASGVVYALAMMCVMKAWEHVPSTIVVPLMQLSGPMVETLEACLGSVARRRGKGKMGVLAPVAHATLTHKDVLAFILITVGGLTPSTESLPQLFRLATWRRPSMALLMASNILYSLYFVTLSLCVGVDSSKDPRLRRPSPMEETQFVVISNLSSVATLAFLFTVTPRLRSEMRALKNVATKPKLISGFAECTNYLSMLMLTGAYQLHYSSGLVTAARTGMNQFTNVIFALALYSTFKVGRPVENLRKKLIAAGVVCVGLAISAE